MQQGGSITKELNIQRGKKKITFSNTQITTAATTQLLFYQIIIKGVANKFVQDEEYQTSEPKLSALATHNI